MQTVAMSIFALVVHLILMFQIKGIKPFFVHSETARELVKNLHSKELLIAKIELTLNFHLVCVNVLLTFLLTFLHIVRQCHVYVPRYPIIY